MKIISLLTIMLAFGSQAIAAEKKPASLFEIYNEAKSLADAIGDRGTDSNGKACKFSARLDPNNDEGEEGKYALWLSIENEEDNGLSLVLLSEKKFETVENTLANGTVIKQVFHGDLNFLNFVDVPGISASVRMGVEEPMDCAVYH